ncbi:hypothetical protein CLI64_08150 [Nostoc sp. CENA543]|uniref:hypothetical protein n=1 Tax=Nostoc sp. CENA543 TaxID=1869241 RepID=UPI000CA090FD|nr:hypothetical protein [Nostoc sp. CENA543]AUT00360.1 hypothetical protein CLI64_08150 [Nostoc sp. CENA543]
MTDKPEIVIDLPTETYQRPVEPKVSDKRWLSLLFNSLITCYSTALCVQVLTFIPLTLPALTQLPKIAAVIIMGVGAWLAYRRQLPALTLSFAIGLLVGL